MPSRRRRVADAVCGAAILVLMSAAPAARAGGDDAPPLKGAMLGEGDALYLEVLVNGRAVGLVAAFHVGPDGELSIAPEELEELGLRADPAAIGPDGRIALARLAGVASAYDAARQEMRFTAAAAALRPHRIAVAPRLADIAPVSGDTGAVLNYVLYAAGGRSDGWRFEGVSGLLEGRAFGPFGMISGAAIGRSAGPGPRWRRLETAWSWSDPSGPTTYRAGDLVTGALAWSRPVRLGGVQVRRNFALRPDLVTHPTARFEGTADVPSTVEVYIDGARRVSTEAPAGPFEISDLPLTTGAGTARVVVRDALGRSQISETPFYASGDMLAEGLFDLSLEIGAPRRDFGGPTDSYDTRIFGSGSVRYGVSDVLTLEAHAEGGGGLAMGGAGFVTRLGAVGALSLAAAASRFDGRWGARVHASVELALGDVRVFALSQRGSDTFADIASVSTLYGSFAPPRALDQVALALPELWDGASLTLSYARIARTADEVAEVASTSFSQDLPGSVTLFVSAFTDIGHSGGHGVFAGVSAPLGGRMSAGGNLTSNARRTALVAEVIRAENGDPGGFGWRIRAGEDIQAARLSYRADIARFEGSVWHGNGGLHATVQMEGALVLAGGGAFASPRIDDAFAVVDTGVPDVAVKLENRFVGRTDGAGRILVTGLRAYERNRLAIDPDDLPAGADVATVVRDVTPGDRAGAHVDFAVTAAPAAAVVTLRDAAGLFIAPGATAVLASNSESFVVGYEGQTYVKGLGAANRLSVTTPAGTVCLADFPYRPGEGSAPQSISAACVADGAGR